jgi:hypothetical protein
MFLAGSSAVGQGGERAGLANNPVNSDALAHYDPPTSFPKAGTDAFQSIAQMKVQPGCSGGPITLDLAGPTVVKRSAPTEVDGKQTIDTEMVSMTLTGFDPTLGSVTLRESPTQDSIGQVQESKAGGQAFPAQSFFDVFVEIDLEHIGTLHNQSPMRMKNAGILGIPPIGSEYRPPTGYGPVQLFDGSNNVVACLVHVSHVPEDPSHVLLKLELIGLETKLYEMEQKLDAICTATSASC